MKIGIFFGGQSREREVSFAGGRTVYDNLNKNVFEAIPIFVDSLGNFILLDWEYIYNGTIRDFYPPVDSLPKKSKFQIYIESLKNLSEEEAEKVCREVGQKISSNQLKDYFDFAFLALHGAYGEDGNIQGILEWQNIPYSGSGILPSAIGINKVYQNQILTYAGFERPKNQIFSKKELLEGNLETIFQNLQNDLGLPLVVKSPHQGSSIGISILRKNDIEQFKKAVYKSFFIQEIDLKAWQKLDNIAKQNFIVQFTDIREGLGFPVYAEFQNEKKLFFCPEELLAFLNTSLPYSADSQTLIKLIAEDSEEEILFEEYLDGKEFSCIVVQDEDGKPLALPPTEIIKYNELFDYRSKYLPGTSRKVTPIDVGADLIEKIRQECCRLFKVLNCNVYARIDGFITRTNNKILLNDPNTTSGMLPSSFFFHQAAEIGLNPSQFLTYIIRTSLAERLKTGKKNYALRKSLTTLDKRISDLQNEKQEKIKVAVIMGGFSSERHISMESGRNIYEKLASSTKYEPFPVFLSGNEDNHELYVIPINIMLKDNADDVYDKIKSYEQNKDTSGYQVIQNIIKEARNITKKYAGLPIFAPKQIAYKDLAELCKVVFIALHGRPGEDGAIQQHLEKYNLPYNGSGVESSQKTINKFETNEILRKQRIKVANHALLYQKDWEEDSARAVADFEAQFSYPIIAKPADDGCSSAVKKVKNREEFIAYANMAFRPLPEFLEEECKILKLKQNEEFPQKNYFLIEDLITQKDADYFLEITGGMLTHWENNELKYEVFEPSETLAQGEVLSLEEKFLAGEGQNITPATYDLDREKNKIISKKIRAELEKVAQILNIQGYARIDAFVRIYKNMEVEVIIIEVNSLPGMTPATCIFHQAAINDYKPYHFIDKILSFAMAEKMSLEKATK